jgi:hypothetical protein
MNGPIIAGLIIFAIIILFLAFYLYAGSERAKQQQVILREQARQIGLRYKERSDHINELIRNGVSDERIREIKQEWERKDNPPVGPSQLFTFDDVIIVYEITDPSAAAQVTVLSRALTL